MRQYGILFFCALLFFFCPLSAQAAPDVHSFSVPAAELAAIKTVFVLPAKMPAAFPDADVSAAIKNKWSALIQEKKKSGGFALLTPADLLQKHSMATGERVKTQKDGAAQTRQASSLAPRYADAVLSINISKCDYSGVHHPQTFETTTTFVEELVWEEGKWVMQRRPASSNELKPAWTERFAEVELRMELWGLKKGNEKLLFSCTVDERISEKAGGGKLPHLADVATRAMETAWRKLP